MRGIRNQVHVADTLRRELSWTARLGVPLSLGELGWMSTYIIDALMIGRLAHSALAISASSLGNTIFYAIVFCVIRCMTGLDTLLAQAFGNRDESECVRLLGQSIWFVILGTPLVIALTLGSLPLLPHLGTPPEIVAETSRYLHALCWSTPPLLVYMALRRYLQSIDRVILVMISLVTSGLVNLAGDWAFLYGHLGLHPMGIAGSGWATVIVRFYMMALLLVGVAMALRRGSVGPTWRLLIPDLVRLRMLLGIGWPAALGNVTDLGVSTFMSILCARLGTQMLAAHQVVLDLDAVVFMVPTGLSYATIIRAGQSAGRNNLSQVRRSADAGLALAMGFICIAAALFASFPHLWAGLYTNDAGVITAAAPLFLICGVLQFGDAASVIFSAALTGVGNTRAPMVVNAVWYWLLGMPFAYWLTFEGGYGVKGLWIGRAIAAIGSALHLAYIWTARMRSAEANPQRSRLSLVQTMLAREAHS